MVITTRPQALPLFLGVVALLVGEAALHEIRHVQLEVSSRKEEFKHELLTVKEQTPSEVSTRPIGLNERLSTVKGQDLREMSASKEQLLSELNAKKQQILREVDARKQAFMDMQARMLQALKEVDARKQQAFKDMEARMQQVLKEVETRKQQALKEVDKRKQQALEEINAMKQQELEEINAMKQQAIEEMKKTKDALNEGKSRKENSKQKKCLERSKTRKNYTVFLEEVPHPKAVAICERMGGRLALPINEEENKQIKSEVAKSKTSKKSKGYWIGADDKEVEGIWTNSVTGKPLCYTNFDDGHENHEVEDCGVVHSRNGKWSDADCNSGTFITVCETTAKDEEDDKIALC